MIHSCYPVRETLSYSEKAALSTMLRGDTWLLFAQQALLKAVGPVRWNWTMPTVPWMPQRCGNQMSQPGDSSLPRAHFPCLGWALHRIRPKAQAPWRICVEQAYPNRSSHHHLATFSKNCAIPHQALTHHSNNVPYSVQEQWNHE